MKSKQFTLPLAPTLPDELMEEILLRLPVRCLVRFKCVCKSWLSLISDPQFAKSHYDLAFALTHRLILCCETNSIDIEAPLNDDSTELTLHFPNPSPAHIQEYVPINVVGSCRGFLLLNTELFDIIYFIIWNPSTGLKKRFSKPLCLKFSYLCGIGYDSSTDDYVVVLLSGKEIHCFSSRSNSWSCTTSTVLYSPMGGYFDHGFLLNGALHWLVQSHDFNVKIIVFDVMERRLSEIPLPRQLKENRLYHLRVLGGCLCLSLCFSTGYPKLWIMKEYKVQSSWTVLFGFSTFLDGPNDFAPICSTKNGEILAYDCENKILMRLSDKGKRLEQRRTRCNHIFMHSESLISLSSNEEEQQ